MSNKTQRLKDAYIFIGGVILSAIGGEILEGAAVKNEYTIIIFTIIAIAVAIYFFHEIYKKVEKTLDWNLIKVNYIREEYREKEGIPYKGIIHDELTKIVSDAEKEILVIAGATKHGAKSVTMENPKRKQYLDALEQTIERKSKKGFRYIRIEYFPPSIKLEDLENIDTLREHFGNINIEHTKNIEKLNKKYHDKELDISIMKAITQKYGDLMIIDKRIVAIENLNSILISEDASYNEGLFIFDDREGHIVKQYLKYFDKMMKYALPIKIIET